MKSPDAAEPGSFFKNLPSVDELLRSETGRSLVGETGTARLTRLARFAVEHLRERLSESTEKNYSKEVLLSEAEKLLLDAWRNEQRSGQRRVINATGVVIHTNLGRAPLSEAARTAILEASGYCTLEYELETGRRGKRGARAEQLLAELTGGEAALVVNNCAAAAFLVLTVLAAGGEVIVSRGELVEIGGDFRIPDVLAQSGATLREVGTTNRTKIADYEKAINDNTKLILKVHPSNYRIIGFTSTPTTAELADLAHRNGIVFYEDAGSGALFDLGEFGLGDEPVIRHCIDAGADVVTFSGDKLLGGSQTGLIAGRKEIMDRLRKHPLYRALRADKLVYAALEATLEAHARGSALDDIPALKMLSMSKEEIAERAFRLSEQLRARLGEESSLRIEIIDGISAIGGGSAPAVQPATTLIALQHDKIPTARLEQLLRMSEPPVIARILDNRVVIDLRTVGEREEVELLEILRGHVGAN